MSSETQLPDYELEDLRIIASTPELKAAFHPLRNQLLDLVLERAATVAELAEAVDRPKSSVAYHVDVLLDAGLLRVVRTRKVRAIAFCSSNSRRRRASSSGGIRAKFR